MTKSRVIIALDFKNKADVLEFHGTLLWRRTCNHSGYQRKRTFNLLRLEIA